MPASDTLSSREYGREVESSISSNQGIGKRPTRYPLGLFAYSQQSLLTPTLETRSSGGQYWFRDGRSMEDAITRLYDIAVEAEERYVIAIFVDIQSAFDSLCWPALVGELKQRDCSRNLYLINRSYLTRRDIMMEDCYHMPKEDVEMGPSCDQDFGIS